MALLLIASTTAVCSLTASTTCGPTLPNVIANGSFQTFDATGWTLDCPDAGCAVLPDPWGFVGYFQRTPVSGGTAKLSQSVPFKHGLYGLSFFYFPPQGGVAFDPAQTFVQVRVGAFEQRQDFGGPHNVKESMFIAAGGAETVSFTFHAAPGTGPFNFGSVYAAMIEDGGAAQSANAAHQATQLGAERFVSAIFGASGPKSSGPEAGAAVPVLVAGPAAAGTAKSNAWVSAATSETNLDWFDTSVREKIIAGGVDTEAGGGWTAGFAAAISTREGEARGDVSSIASDGTSVSFALTAQWRPDASPFYGKAAAGGGLSTRDHSRILIFGPDTGAARDIDGAHVFAAAEIGAVLKLDDATLTPFARLSAGQSREEAYREIASGPDFSATSVANAERPWLSSRLGVHGSIPIFVFGLSGRVSADAAWRHEFLDPRAIGYTIHYPGAGNFDGAFPAAGISQDAAAASAAFETTVDDGVSVFLRYDGETGSEHTARSAQAGLRAAW
jgi:uncharacterized protein with beta-barrel porin domain